MNILNIAMEVIREAYFRTAFIIGCIVAVIIFVAIIMLRGLKHGNHKKTSNKIA